MSFLQALNYLKDTLARSVDGACAVPAVFIQYHPGTLLGPCWDKGQLPSLRGGHVEGQISPYFSLCIHLVIENLREP